MIAHDGGITPTELADFAPDPRSPAQPTCVLLGSESLVVQCGDMLLQRGWRIAAVVSKRASVRGWAEQGALPVVDTAAALAAMVAPEGVDYVFSITNLSVLSADVLALARRGAINFHDGPLPDYAGLNTPAWALMNGEAQHGVTWHLMTAGIDRGDILVERRFAIHPDDTALSLNTRCFAAGVETFDELVDGLSRGTLHPRAQANAPRHYYGRDARPPQGGIVAWDAPAEAIARTVRALQFGAHANPLGSARTALAGAWLLVEAAEVEAYASTLPPGTIVRADPGRIVVATGTQDLAITALTDRCGRAVVPADLPALVAGARFDSLDPATRAAIVATGTAIAIHEPFWRARLRSAAPVTLPQVDATAPHGLDAPAIVDATLPGGTATDLVAAAIAYVARVTDRAEVVVGHTDPIIAAQVEGTAGAFAAQVPLAVTVDFAQPFATLAAGVAGDIRALHRRTGFATDLVARTPELRGGARDVMPVAVVLVDALDDARALPGSDVTLAIRSDARACRWLHDPQRISGEAVAAIHRQLATLAAAALADPATPVATLPLLDAAERRRVLVDWNATETAWRDDACLHDLVAEQAARTPDTVAVVCRARSLTYRELDARANRLARRLVAEGVAPGVLVGLYLERSVDLPVAMLAVHRAGGAYVPLDPHYPADRIAYMIADACMPVVLVTGHVRDQLPATDATVIVLDTAWPTIAQLADAPLGARATPADLAYVIYTSGSTGQPKGVMVEHRNAVNFFAGMDATIAAPGTWLAVTSLSFDISLLELYWTLTRGFTVVVQTGDIAAAAAPAVAQSRLDFSLFYFASAAGAGDGGAYRLLLEGARFADTHGFAAVWTPERHFHAFGGLYPNPSVTSAAIAAVTDRVQIRAGSVVLPLHHPARVAEEWAVVDNISNGRVGISFAAGWQPDDFALRPENFADAKQVMLRDVDTVRRLWRGEAVDCPGALGKPVAIRTLPRPVQPELPFWLTAAGNVETFEAAGRMGANLLTHLLGQTVEELTEKLAAYRAARRAAGHPGDGHATLMLHSFVGGDADMVRQTVRQPLIEYLRSSASLIRQYAWSFPAFKRRPGMEEGGAGVDLQSLEEDEFAALLDHAFERYYADAGLFGTVEQCAAMIARVRAAGVDEVACLIDFGIETQAVLDALPSLDTLRAASQPAALDDDDAPSLATLMQRHGVTHLQCTPSMARMMLDAGGAATFAGLRHLMVGGEALPPSLAADLWQATSAAVTNMYGPTETTVWSATDTLRDADAAVTIGRPLANQQLFLLDRRGEPVPIGVPGEIVIGGRGVTRGYLHRAGLTAERFVAHPLAPGERVYRTGDLGRFRADGRVAFLGRLDHQVKVRGHRIELGEIEAALAAQDSVAQAVVVAREDQPGDTRLHAYVVAAPRMRADAADLRDGLRARLPDFMVPSHIVVVAALPRTPNDKVDRNALAALDVAAAAVPDAAFVAPTEGVEAEVAAIWRDVLKLPQIGVNDNFFDIGGHSLLAVQLHRRLKAGIAPTLAITDIFRFPTIGALCGHVGGASAAQADEDAGRVQHRALKRLAAIGRRRGTIAVSAMGEGGD